MINAPERAALSTDAALRKVSLLHSKLDVFLHFFCFCLAEYDWIVKSVEAVNTEWCDVKRLRKPFF